jgi:hypothetical protein
MVPRVPNAQPEVDVRVLHLTNIHELPNPGASKRITLSAGMELAFSVKILRIKYT